MDEAILKVVVLGEGVIGGTGGPVGAPLDPDSAPLKKARMPRPERAFDESDPARFARRSERAPPVRDPNILARNRRLPGQRAKRRRPKRLAPPSRLDMAKRGVNKILGSVGINSSQLVSGISDLAGAAGLAGKAFLVAEAASIALAKAINLNTEGIKKQAEIQVLQVSGRPMDAYLRQREQMAEVIEKVPILGRVMAAEMRNYIERLRALNEVTRAEVERGKQLQIYSPQLAAANIRKEIAQIRSDILESQLLGPDLARLTNAETRRDMALNRIHMIERAAEDKMHAEQMEQQAQYFEMNKKEVLESDLKYKQLMSFLTGRWGDLINQIKEMPKLLQEAIDRENALRQNLPDKFNQFMQDFQNQAGFFGNPLPSTPPAAAGVQAARAGPTDPTMMNNVGQGVVKGGLQVFFPPGGIIAGMFF